MTETPVPAVSEAQFKMAMRQVTAPVAIVTARVGKVYNGLTATAICAATASPPSVLICVNRNASADRLIAESGAFAVNFLTEEQHWVARLFSTAKMSAEERFDGATWTSLVTGSPILDQALASFDCRVESCEALGTHHIYVGSVQATTSLDKDGLLYRNGSFRRLEPVT